jgi:hypothetical protein
MAPHMVPAVSRSLWSQWNKHLGTRLEHSLVPIRQPKMSHLDHDAKLNGDKFHFQCEFHELCFIS